MRCNWCDKGEGRTYTKSRSGMIFYYYCQECIGDITKGMPFTFEGYDAD